MNPRAIYVDGVRLVMTYVMPGNTSVVDTYSVVERRLCNHV